MPAREGVAAIDCIEVEGGIDLSLSDKEKKKPKRPISVKKAAKARAEAKESRAEMRRYMG